MRAVGLIIYVAVLQWTIVGFIYSTRPFLEVYLQRLQLLLYRGILLPKGLLLVSQRFFVVWDVLTHIENVGFWIVITFVHGDWVILRFGVKTVLVVNFLNLGVMFGILLDLLMLGVFYMEVDIIKVDFGCSWVRVGNTAAKT